MELPGKLTRESSLFINLHFVPRVLECAKTGCFVSRVTILSQDDTYNPVMNGVTSLFRNAAFPLTQNEIAG